MARLTLRGVAGVTIALAGSAAASSSYSTKSGILPWVDPDTPDNAQTYTSSRGDTWTLTMSDEFNTEGRSFEAGDDHLWVAMEKADGVNSALEVYSTNMTGTECDDDRCYFYINTTDETIEETVWNDYISPPGYQTVYFYYRSGMVQSWNKFCFQNTLQVAAFRSDLFRVSAAGSEIFIPGGRRKSRQNPRSYNNQVKITDDYWGEAPGRARARTYTTAAVAPAATMPAQHALETKESATGSGMQGTASVENEESWSTARRTRHGKSAGRVAPGQGRAMRENKSEASRGRETLLSTGLTDGARRGKELEKGRRGGVTRGQGGGDGRVVFEQLRKYLRSEAPVIYVQQTVRRLIKLAEERRFQAYLKLLPAYTRRENSEVTLREQWQDAIPYRLRQRCEDLESEWDPRDAVHQERLTQLMRQWVLTDKASQRELEERLRFFSFGPEEVCTEPSEARVPATFLEAVRPGSSRSEIGLTSEQSRLRELCLRPAYPVTKLRKRTDDEKKALLMILNHEIEVPNPPPFLTQTMTAGELAAFEDLFLALDYPLYAHIAPGQRFHDNMPKSALLNLIQGGPELAQAHKARIEEFKADASRVCLDMGSRTFKVTFKGKVTAAKWEGWQVPLAGRLLTLIDYELIRERSKTTHELVMVDYYSFVVELRQGDMTSTEMYQMLSSGLGLQVQALEHTRTTDMGMLDTQWQVRVQASQCPAGLKDKGHIVCGLVEAVVHHAAIHVNWPCRKCRSPEHPTKVCQVPADEVNVELSRHTVTVEPILHEVGSSAPRPAGRTRQRAPPTTMKDLEAMLRKEADATVGARKGVQPPTASEPKVMPSPRKLKPEKPVVRLALPGEWGQSRKSMGRPASSPQLEDIAAIPACTETSKPVGASPAQELLTPVKPNPPPQRKDATEAAVMMALDSEVKNGEEELPNIDSGTSDHEMEDLEEKEPVPTHRSEVETRIKILQPTLIKGEDSPLRGRRVTPRKKANDASGRNPHWSHRMHSLDSSVSNLAEGRMKTAKRSGDNRGRPGRTASFSPKRRADRRWVEGPERDPRGAQLNEDCVRGSKGKARSESPKRRNADPAQPRGKQAMQKFMHEFVVAITGREGPGAADGMCEPTNEGDDRQHDKTEERPQSSTAATLQDLSKRVGTETSEEGGFHLVKVSPPTDDGAPLADWLAILGGSVVNVAANGHCGWLAFYAALYNVRDGVDGPKPSAVNLVNLLKRRVLNEMIANLRDEAQLHPTDMRAEAAAYEGGDGPEMTEMDRLCMIANHLAAQRSKSVRSTAPLHYWVRPMHLKAMAMHARETIYVLDVEPTDTARVQAYAYHNVENKQGVTIETGTVCPIPTVQAMALLTDLVAAGIRPPVMILKWSPTGNHFQAVNYPQVEHGHYAKNIVALAPVRNSILEDHGWKSLDTIEFDPAKTASTATSELTAIREMAKKAPSEPQIQSVAATADSSIDTTGVQYGAQSRTAESGLLTDKASTNFPERELDELDGEAVGDTAGQSATELQNGDPEQARTVSQSVAPTAIDTPHRKGDQGSSTAAGSDPAGSQANSAGTRLVTEATPNGGKSE